MHGRHTAAGGDLDLQQSGDATGLALGAAVADRGTPRVKVVWAGVGRKMAGVGVHEMQVVREAVSVSSSVLLLLFSAVSFSLLSLSCLMIYF